MRIRVLLAVGCALWVGSLVACSDSSEGEGTGATGGGAGTGGTGGTAGSTGGTAGSTGGTAGSTGGTGGTAGSTGGTAGAAGSTGGTAGSTGGTAGAAGSTGGSGGSSGGANASHIMDHNHTDVRQVPVSFLNAAVSDLHVAHWHTSHGSQVPSGLAALQSLCSGGSAPADCPITFSGLDYDDSNDNEPGNYSTSWGGHGCPDLSNSPGCVDHLGSSGYAYFVDDTVEWLTNHPDLNVIVWSWCSISGHDIDNYLNGLDYLSNQYAEGTGRVVHFIAQSGHTAGSDQAPITAAQQIRTFVETANRSNLWMLDYADIESYDPDGTYYADVTDNLSYPGGNWASEWLADNSTHWHAQVTDSVSGCAHSDGDSRLNCALKGQATWWILARIAGWDGQ